MVGSLCRLGIYCGQFQISFVLKSRNRKERLARAWRTWFGLDDRIFPAVAACLRDAFCDADRAPAARRECDSGKRGKM